MFKSPYLHQYIPYLDVPGIILKLRMLSFRTEHPFCVLSQLHWTYFMKVVSVIDIHVDLVEEQSMLNRGLQ